MQHSPANKIIKPRVTQPASKIKVQEIPASKKFVRETGENYFFQNIFSFLIPKDSEDTTKKIFGHSFVFRLLGLGIIYLSQVLLARLMGTKGYGDYTVIISSLNILLVVCLFGFDTSILRFLPSAIAKKEYSAAYGVVRFSYRVITVLSIICCVGVFVFLLAKSKKFNINFFSVISSYLN